MTYIDQEDGIEKLSRSERYEVSGYVTIKVPIRYETSNEPGEDDDEQWNAISDVVGPDFDIVDTSELDYEVSDE